MGGPGRRVVASYCAWHLMVEIEGFAVLDHDAAARAGQRQLLCPPFAQLSPSMRAAAVG